MLLILTLNTQCLYAVTGRTICGVDKDFQKYESQGALPMAIRLQRLVSYFGDEEGLKGLMKHVGDDDTNCQILSMLWEEQNAEQENFLTEVFTTDKMNATRLKSSLLRSHRRQQ